MEWWKILQSIQEHYPSFQKRMFKQLSRLIFKDAANMQCGSVFEMNTGKHDDTEDANLDEIS